MQLYGTLPTGEKIYKFTLKSALAEAEIISYGARIASFRPYGRDIVAGFECLGGYMADKWFHGATVGRVCNRTAGAAFVMDGVRYELTKNNGENCLHGGADNFSDKAWEVISYTDSSVSLGYTAPDGQSGFPGEIAVRATFSLEGAALKVAYAATPDKKTPIMMTNHSYFNLDGFGGDVCAHILRVWADEYIEISPERVPIGKRPLDGGALDFRAPRAIGERMGECPLGYDHNFVLSSSEVRDGLKLAAEITAGGLKMRAYTDQPGVQFYVPRSQMKALLRGGATLVPYGAFCLESQIEPNAAASGKCFVEAGEEYRSTTVFAVEKI